MYAVVNGWISWSLLWLAAIILICGVTYLGRRQRKLWQKEEEDQYDH